jgi:hypothetical protein
MWGDQSLSKGLGPPAVECEGLRKADRRRLSRTEEPRGQLIDQSTSPSPLLPPPPPGKTLVLTFAKPYLLLLGPLKGQFHEMVVEVRPWSGRLGLN